jgi:pimeloyl-ACP methyl ester carboxylesterase
MEVDLMPELTANGLRFFVVDEGSGAPVVLLHGFPDTSALWRAQIAALVPAGYRTIAPDLRGRGRTERPARVDDYTLANIVQDVAAILDGLGVERAHVVGHDWGAAVAWVFAALLPQRVDHLCVISVGHPGTGGILKPSLEELQKSWYQLLFQFEGVAEELLQRDDWYLLRELVHGGGDIERYIQDLSQPGALTAGLNWYRANLHPRLRLGRAPALPPVQAPTLAIYSTGDLYLPEERVVRSAKFVSGPWRYERFEGVSHWVPTQAPDRLNQLLLEFFRG